jgi:hypothetical protein
MGLAFGPLLGIVRTRPEGMADGFAGPFHEGLSEELRALEAPVDPTRVPAPFGDGRNARILLEVTGGRIAVKPRQNFRYTSGELTRPYLATSARRATRAAQWREKALGMSEPLSSNPIGYTDPVRSAKFPTGVNKIMTRFVAVAWFAKGHEETRGEDGAGAWERLKEGEVGMSRG